MREGRWVGAHVQRQTQMQDIARAQQFVKPDIQRRLPLQASAIMILHPHPQRLGPLLHFPPDAPHAQDAQQLALRVVPERGGGGAFPGVLAQRRDCGGEVSESAEEQEERGVGGGGVDGGGHVGDLDVPGGAGGDVDLVVAGAWRGRG